MTARPQTQGLRPVWNVAESSVDLLVHLAHRPFGVGRGAVRIKAMSPSWIPMVGGRSGTNQRSTCAHGDLHAFAASNANRGDRYGEKACTRGSECEQRRDEDPETGGRASIARVEGAVACLPTRKRMAGRDGCDGHDETQCREHVLR